MTTIGTIIKSKTDGSGVFVCFQGDPGLSLAMPRGKQNTLTQQLLDELKASPDVYDAYIMSSHNGQWRTISIVWQEYRGGRDPGRSVWETVYAVLSDIVHLQEAYWRTSESS